MLDMKELSKRMDEFMIKYGRGYAELSAEDEFLWLEQSVPSYIQDYYKMAYNEPRVGESIFQQIFSGIEAMDDKYNPFRQMVLRLEEEYGLDRDFVEVGCGFFPALAYEIAKRKRELGIEKGKITAYDAKLVTTTLNGVTLVKDKFYASTIVPADTVLIGRRPCEATEAIVRNGAVNNLEIYIQLCSCEEHVPKAYRLSHKPIKGQTILEMYTEELTRDTLPIGFRVEKEKVLEQVGDQPSQQRYETVIKTKKIR